VTVETRAPLADRRADLASIGATEVPFLAQVSLRLDPTNADPLPFELPLEPNTWTSTPSKDALWLGPDEWLLVGAADAALDIIAEVRAALGESAPFSAVDTSANRVAIDIAAEATDELLPFVCGLDLDARAWRHGLCVQTLVARVPAILQHRGDTIRVFLRPSFAAPVLDVLLAVRT